MSHRQRDIQHVSERLGVLEANRDVVMQVFEGVRTRTLADLQAIDEEVTSLNLVRKHLVRLEVESRPPEYANGIDVSRLDPETRLMVESGNQETISVLRAAAR